MSNPTPAPTAIFANPGQDVTLVIQTLDGYGTRADGYAAPQIDFIITQTATLAGFPQPMNSIGTGLYSRVISIAAGLTSLGTTIVSVSWPKPTTGVTQHEVFIIHVALPFGNTTVIPA